MRENQKRLPIGIDNFVEMRRENFYYVDKTGLIADLLDDWGKVNLFTRPRRFGKSLNMDMLRAFFEIGTDPCVFEGLEIADKPEVCEKYMGNYPVLKLSLKDAAGYDYDSAYHALGNLISDEARRICRKYQLLQSDRLHSYDKSRLEDLMSERYEQVSQLVNSLKMLSQLLYVHCEQKVILLIDEYDVPLDKAYGNGYYEEMLELIRGVLSAALKSNESLYFAVLTGCLRIAKESIFTGLNNFIVNSVSDLAFADYFGFTKDEVDRMLAYYGMEDFCSVVKEWYDGYHFGQVEVYCPWDVVNYLRKLRVCRETRPESYWVNSSSNEIIHNLLQNATQTTKNNLESLISGEIIEKKLFPELTYKDLDSEDPSVRETYLWSVLYAAGYLTEIGRTESGISRLKIPNREIREIYDDKIRRWFQDTVRSNSIRWKN